MDPTPLDAPNPHAAVPPSSAAIRPLSHCGETPFKTDEWMSRSHTGHKRHLWTRRHAHVLKNIVDQEPGLHLDEIVDRVNEITHKKWSPSQMQTKLRKAV